MIVCIQSLLALLWERSNTKQSIVDILDTHCWGTYIRYIRLHLYCGDVDALSEMLWCRQKYPSTSLSAHRANNRQALFKISAINSIQSMIMLRNY